MFKDLSTFTCSFMFIAQLGRERKHCAFLRSAWRSLLGVCRFDTLPVHCSEPSGNHRDTIESEHTDDATTPLSDFECRRNWKRRTSVKDSFDLIERGFHSLLVQLEGLLHEFQCIFIITIGLKDQSEITLEARQMKTKVRWEMNLPYIDQTDLGMILSTTGQNDVTSSTE